MHFLILVGKETEECLDEQRFETMSSPFSSLKEKKHTEKG